MVARRVALLLMLVATGVVAKSPTSVTDGELAKVVVEKTSKFLEGPTGRALSIQDRFQGWMNSLENQISDLAYNAVNRATSAISRIPFFETYFSQYQSPLPSMQREPPKQPPILYLYPQSPQYLNHDDVEPSVPDAIGQFASNYLQQAKLNILAPDATDDYQDHEDETSWDPQEFPPQLPPYSQPPYGQAPELYRQPNPKMKGPYLQAQEPNQRGQERDSQSQEQYLVAQQKQPESVKLQDFDRPKFQSSSLQDPVFSSGQQNSYISLPPLTPQPLHANSDVNNAIERVFTEDGDHPSNVQGKAGFPEQPNLAGDGSHRQGPYYPDPVEGGFTLEPAALYPSAKSAQTSDKEGNPSAKPSVSQNLQKYTPDQYLPPLSAYTSSGPFGANLPLPSRSVNNHLQPISSSNPLLRFVIDDPTQPFSANNYSPLPSYRPTPRQAYRTEVASRVDLVDAVSSGINATNNPVSSGLSRHRRTTWENFSIWNLFSDNSVPTALYCPSGGVKLLMCAGDQLFDAFVKAPIESAKDWVSNIDLHSSDL